MKITASVPAYNSGQTIKETLISLLNQTYPFEKIKVYDNKSSDDTREVVKSLMRDHPTLNLIENEVNLGGEGNFSRCIAEAEGDCCVVAHADDIYHKEFSKTAVDVIRNNAGVVAIAFAANEIDEHGKIKGQRFIPEELNGNSVSIIDSAKGNKLFYKYGNFITCPSVVVLTEIYREKIKVWSGANFKTSADLDVWMRLLEFGKIGFVKECLINYRVAEASYSFRVAKKRITKHDLFLVLDHHEKNLSIENKENYLFLHLKDQALRSLNIIRTKNHDIDFPTEVKFDFFLVMKKIFLSKWHLKFGISILGIKLLTSIFDIFGWKKS